ncbi:DUF2790 domain-containing protein [Pseudomonas sp.]|uniref:DUF2790 domain-containing protein n=1 Tax=Pseudomonas sp. TaxID=306 RepID=UPI003977AE1C
MPRATNFGQKLDIGRVVQQPDLGFCGACEVEMTHEYGAGQRHRLRHPVWSRDGGTRAEAPPPCASPS